MAENETPTPAVQGGGTTQATGEPKAKVNQAVPTAAPKVTAKSNQSEDAVSLLRNDHRSVEKLFESYRSATRGQQKKKLAQQICRELTIHALLEEEIFYAACKEKNVEEDMLDEAQVEHDGAKTLIIELQAGSPADEYYDAKVSVLSEMVKHHVNEEEKGDGIFAKAKAAGLDLKEIGQRVSQRKAELTAEAEAGGLPSPELHSMKQTGFVKPWKENEMPQQQRGRDERGRSSDEDDRRYSSGPSRGGRGRDDDDEDRRGRRNADRDEYGRFMSDDDSRGGRSSGRGRSRDDDDDDDDRRGRRNADRDEYGRFMSDDDSRGGRSSGRGRSRDDDDDDDRRGRRNADRDENGRFMSDDDSRGGRSSGRGRSRDDDDDDDRRGRRNADRDENGRFMSDDDSRGGRSSGRGRSRDDDDDDDDRRGRRNADRDENGRFMSDDDSRGGRSSGRGRSRDDDDDDRRGRRNAERDEDGRFTSGRGSSARSGGGSSRDDDDDRRSSGSRNQGGWFGDRQGHAEAARRGWEERSGRSPSSRDDDDDSRSRRARSRDDDDDDRRSSTGSGRGQGGGWFGDPKGHSEASRRGWRNR